GMIGELWFPISRPVEGTMHRMLRTSPRIHLEKLEDRCQPGSLLTDFASWSLLGQDFAVLQLDHKAKPVTPLLRYESTIPLGHSVTSTAITGHEQADTALPTTPVTTRPAEAGTLLAIASVRATPLDEGGGSITKLDGTWYTLASMPSRRQEVPSAVLGVSVDAVSAFAPKG